MVFVYLITKTTHTMKKYSLIILGLLFSMYVSAQHLIPYRTNHTTQGQLSYQQISGYQTHFDQDSNWVSFYNASDTLSFWTHSNNSDSVNLWAYTGLKFAGSGFVNLKVYNSVDDTMFLENAVYVVPPKSHWRHLDQYKTLYTGIYGQKQILLARDKYHEFDK
jgi:hypothetical protein